MIGAARFLGSVLYFFAARLHGGGAGCMEVLQCSILFYCKAAWGRSWMYGSAGILALASSFGFVQE